MPTHDQLARIAEAYGLAIDPRTLDGYCTLVGGTLKACAYLDTLPEQTLPLTHPRTPGWKPQSQDNPGNSWTWRCEIEGASSGFLVRHCRTEADLKVGAIYRLRHD